MLKCFTGVLAAALIATASFAAPQTDPFRVVATPTGCAVVFDGVPDEYRVDTMVDGGVVVAVNGSDLGGLDRQLADGCIAKYRSSAGYGGAGSSLELRPRGVEFSGVLRSKESLQVIFAKVLNLAGTSGMENVARGSYRIGVGDVLKITVFNHDDLTKEVQVGSDGRIGYSLVGDIDVLGKTLHTLQDELTATLGKDFIVNPQVGVEVKTYSSQFIYVNGPVKNPGRFPLQGGLSIKDALSLAGGFAPDAGYSISLARQETPGSERGPAKLKFARQDIEFGLVNQELESGDVVTVSEKDYVYIQSEVREPGKYELGSGLTLLKAIAVAKGLTDWADRKRVALIRVVGGQTVRETISLKDIERQKAPDVPLLSGDIIIVPRRIL